VKVPLDHPTPKRPHRVYVAVTNHCNRECPWCSTCSSPAGSTWISLASFRRALPETGPFQLQVEGGEPTLHPGLFELVQVARDTGRCDRLILSTNGVALPRDRGRLEAWVSLLGAPLTLKISVNHHLLDRDAGLLNLCILLKDLFSRPGRKRLLVVNVRLRRGHDEDDRAVRSSIEKAGLLDVSNVFFLQRYGFASEEASWDLPEPVSGRFTLVNPDGRLLGNDLIARSLAMKALP
jgi:MoaA/NifB/PqqE/SkfB family radical SAM enzyme